MHWWQIAIHLVLIANCFGNFRGAARAIQEHHRERLHWLIPKAVAWGMLFFALLPAHYGGIGPQRWKIAAGISIVLFFYGMILEMTDSSRPSITWVSLELPQHMVTVSLIGLLLVCGNSFYQHRVTSNEMVFLIGFSLGLLFGVRLLLRQYSLSRFADLVELATSRPRPLERSAQHDWIKPDKDDAPS